MNRCAINERYGQEVVSTPAALKAPSARKEYRFECADSKPGLSQGLTRGPLNLA